MLNGLLSTNSQPAMSTFKLTQMPSSQDATTVAPPTPLTQQLSMRQTPLTHGLFGLSKKLAIKLPSREIMENISINAPTAGHWEPIQMLHS
jgi:hypothetical protein